MKHVFLTFLLVCARSWRVFSHPQYLTCSQTLAVGQPLMLAPYVATLDTTRTVVVTRGSTVLSGSSLTYVPGETLGIAISNTASAEYIFQATNAAFVNGQCSNTRSQVTAPAQLVMPSSGDVTVFFGWQTHGPANVLISPTVTLTAQTTTTSSPSYAPTATVTNAPTAASTNKPTATTSSAPSYAPTAGATNAPSYAPTAATTNQPSFAPTVATSSAPSYAPSAGTTTAPSYAPTAATTNQPSFAPTAATSSTPTAATTSASSLAPTASISDAPSLPPVKVTSSPTETPAAQPTRNPTSVTGTAAPTAACPIPSRKPVRPPVSPRTLRPTVCKDNKTERAIVVETAKDQMPAGRRGNIPVFGNLRKDVK